MKKYYYLLLLILAGANLTQAQEGLPFYEYYLTNDYYLINPGYAGFVNEDIVVRGTYRKQWSDLENAPNTQTLSAHGNFFDRVGLGTYVYRDQNGLSSQTGFQLTAAYQIPLGDYGRSEYDNKLSLGMSFNGYFHKFDVDGVRNVRDQNDPLLLALQEDNKAFFQPNFNLGGFLKYGDFKGGISVLDIPLTNNNEIVNGLEPQPTIYYIMLGYDIYVTDGFVLEPLVLMNLNSNSEQHIDLTMKASILDLSNDSNNKFWFGASFRSDLDAKQTQSLTLTPLVGLTYNRLNIGYGYTIGMTDIAKDIGGSHYISLGYNFDNAWRSNRR